MTEGSIRAEYRRFTRSGLSPSGAVRRLCEATGCKRAVIMRTIRPLLDDETFWRMGGYRK